MSFLVGKNVGQREVSGQAAGLNDSLIQYIKGLGFGGLNPGTTFSEADAAPYRKGFADTNAQTFGQAKEAAGNLTGSGLGQNLGTAAAQAANQQGGFLANLFEQRRQADASRFLELVMGTQNSQAAREHQVHQPGLLEYAGQAAKAAAPFLIPGAQPLAAANLAQTMASGGFGVQAPESLSYTPPSFVAGPGQLGQAARYNFDFTHTNKLNSGQGSAFRGYQDPNRRDVFGIGREY